MSSCAPTINAYSTHVVYELMILSIPCASPLSDPFRLTFLVEVVHSLFLIDMRLSENKLHSLGIMRMFYLFLSKLSYSFIEDNISKPYLIYHTPTKYGLNTHVRKTPCKYVKKLSCDCKKKFMS